MKEIKIGDKYGDYKIVSDPFMENHRPQVYCECKCGKKRKVWLNKLPILKHCIKCGNEKRTKYKIGTKVGFLTILSIFPDRKYQVECVCGKVYFVTGGSLYKIKSCGCKSILYGENNPTFYGYKNISKKYYSQVAIAAKKTGKIFDISIEYMNDLLEEQNFLCKLSGKEIVIGNAKIKTTASLDRIDSNKGYVKGNVQWLHKDVNSIKSNFDQKYFIEICKAITKHN